MESSDFALLSHFLGLAVISLIISLITPIISLIVSVTGSLKGAWPSGEWGLMALLILFLTFLTIFRNPFQTSLVFHIQANGIFFSHFRAPRIICFILKECIEPELAKT